MCAMAMAVESLRRENELEKEGKEKTKDILDMQGAHQITLWWFLASTVTFLHGTEQGSPHLKGHWSQPGSGDTGGAVEHKGQALPSQSLTKSAGSQTMPHAEALSGTSCKVRIQTQIPW